MLTIEAKKLNISDESKRRVEMIYRFVNGVIKDIKKTNISYVKPHVLTINDNNYLIFEDYD